MKKYLGLSNTEEMVLRYLTAAEQWTDAIGLLALNAGLFSLAFSGLTNFLAVSKVILFSKSGKTEEDTLDTDSIYGKSALWVFASLVLARTTLYFVRRYLESKIVSDYDNTEGIERN